MTYLLNNSSWFNDSNLQIEAVKELPNGNGTAHYLTFNSSTIPKLRDINALLPDGLNVRAISIYTNNLERWKELLEGSFDELNNENIIH